MEVRRHAFLSIVALAAIAVMLMTFDGLRQVGISILPSAGIAGVLIGLAAQKSIVIEKPFQNWARNSSEILGTIFL